MSSLLQTDFHLPNKMLLRQIKRVDTDSRQFVDEHLTVGLIL